MDNVQSQTDFAIINLPPFTDIKGMKTYFSIGKRRCWRLIAEREITASKTGKLWIVETASVVKYLKRHRNKSEEGQ